MKVRVANPPPPTGRRAKKKRKKRASAKAGEKAVAKKKTTKKRAKKRSNPKRGHHHGGAHKKRTKKRSNPAHAKPHKKRRKRRHNPGLMILDVFLAPVAGVAAGIATRQLPKVATYNPWAKRIAGGIAAVGGGFLSIPLPRIGAAVATEGLDAAIGDDVNDWISAKLAGAPASQASRQMNGVNDRNVRRFAPGTGGTNPAFPDAIDALIDGVVSPEQIAAIVDAYA